MATAEHGMKLDSKTVQEEILQTGCMHASVSTRQQAVEVAVTKQVAQPLAGYFQHCQR